ncbi:MAG: hypothetical protein V3R99_08535, partial [Thermoguttaceae bacterium]
MMRTFRATLLLSAVGLLLPIGGLAHAALVIDGQLTGVDVGYTAIDPPIGPGGGSTTYNADGDFTLVGGGADLWNTSDQFHFAYTPLLGDGWITARVTGFENLTPDPLNPLDPVDPDAINTWAKAGVMIRGGDPVLWPGDGSDANAAMIISYSNDASNQHRLSLLAVTARDDVFPPLTPPRAPAWVRVARLGNQIAYAFAEDDPANPGTPLEWMTPFAVETFVDPITGDPTFGETVHIGLAVTSHDIARVTQVGFDNVDVVAVKTLTFDAEGDAFWDDARWGIAPPNYPDGSVQIAATIDTTGQDPIDVVTVRNAESAFSLKLRAGATVALNAGTSLALDSHLDGAGGQVNLGAGSTLQIDSMLGVGSSLTQLVTDGSATINTANTLAVTNYVDTVESTLTVTGGGTLAFNAGTGSQGAGLTHFNVSGATLEYRNIDPASANPLGGSPYEVTLDSGTLTMTAGQLNVSDQLSHFGWNSRENGWNDIQFLDGNGGVMAMTPDGTGDPLNSGPGSRGLDFDNDADFITTGAIGV